jgi:hypothetical protein
MAQNGTTYEQLIRFVPFLRFIIGESKIFDPDRRFIIGESKIFDPDRRFIIGGSKIFDPYDCFTLHVFYVFIIKKKRFEKDIDLLICSGSCNHAVRALRQDTRQHIGRPAGQNAAEIRVEYSGQPFRELPRQAHRHYFR